MPRLWDDTIEAHRRAVRDAALDATAVLVATHGIRAVTMSKIAEETGIGRATLYKYFPDIEAILGAWHERQVASHLEQLAALRSHGADHGDRVRTVLEAYALIRYAQDSSEFAAILHQRPHMAHAQQQLSDFIRDLLADAAEAGTVRDDVSPEELAGYCLSALASAGGLSSRAAVRRLVDVTVTGLHAPGKR
jgi:AcrR family transcriptional regulator